MAIMMEAKISGNFDQNYSMSGSGVAANKNVRIGRKKTCVANPINIYLLSIAQKVSMRRQHQLVGGSTGTQYYL